MKRSIDLRKFSEKIFDLAIIGGGITGAGIFQEASKRGYQCVLLEKGDFASGTSSKSAKLIHGGMRYLRYGKFSLVRESLEERNYLLKNYPHLVFPLPFVFPIYNSKLKYHAGMAIYQFLGKGNNLPQYQWRDKQETVVEIPFINQKSLEGSFVYFDAVSNDARLCNEVIHASAQNFSSSLPVNYCEVVAYHLSNSVAEVVCQDHIENEQLTFRANYIINATGVWTDSLLKKLTSKTEKISAPSKGVHIVLDHKRFPMKEAVIIPSCSDDQRLLYGLPWENDTYIIGTTDTEFKGHPENVKVDKADIDYILNSVNHFAPSLKITKDDLLFAYAGLRPLMHEEKESKARSRDYHIWWSNEKMLNIFGGKFTSFHSMAKSLMKEFEKKAGKKSSQKSKIEKPTLYLTDSKDEFTKTILAKYVDQAAYVLDLAKKNPEFKESLNKEDQVYVAELIYFIRYQSCFHLNDLLFRRMSLGYVLKRLKNQEAFLKKIALIMKKECGWSQQEFEMEINNFMGLIQ